MRFACLVLLMLLVLPSAHAALTPPAATAPAIDTTLQRAHELIDGLRRVRDEGSLASAHVFLHEAQRVPVPTERVPPPVTVPSGLDAAGAYLSWVRDVFAVHAAADRHSASAHGSGLDTALLSQLRARLLHLAEDTPRMPLHHGGPLFDVCGVALVHLGTAPFEATCHYPIIIGGFGNDTYHNRAGGNLPGAAALLIEPGGNDQYLGRFDSSGGVNGGAYEGFGALIDRAGDDHYDGHLGNDAQGFAAHGGSNGGARYGVSLLADASGNDHYQGSVIMGGLNGGAGFGADSMLIDLGGHGETFNGTVRGLSGGINGGANDGVARFLHCGTGGATYDGYVEERGGVNGGTEQGVTVFASCGGGGDRYLGYAGGGGVNAGASGIASALFVHLDGDAELSGSARYGGINGGSYLGEALLVSGGGNQTYHGTMQDLGGINGGAVLGTGQLVDLGGDDVYLGRNPGTAGINGAGVSGGAGLLVDMRGEDVYDAWVGGASSPQLSLVPYDGGGVNGRSGPGGCSTLVDLEGTDRFRDDPDADFVPGEPVDVRADCGTPP